MGKLKRHRTQRVVDAQPSVLDNAPGRVELLKPTPEAPAIRRYLPSEGLDVAGEFSALEVLDWRKARPRGQVEPRSVSDRIICGDSVAVLRKLPDECVTCIVTSPPYWNAVDYGYEGQVGPGSYGQYLRDLLKVWRECERVLAPNGKLCINAPVLPVPKAVMGDQHTRHLKNLSSDIEASILRALSLERFGLYVWQKQTTEKMFGSYPFPPNLYEQNTVEFINVFVKPGKPPRVDKAVKECSRLDEKLWMNLTRQVWNLYSRDVRRSGHPAPFPEALPNRLIAMYTFGSCAEPGVQYPGDLVMDPFCGTGATCVAARKLGRRFLGVDLSPDFCIASARSVRAARPDGQVFVCRTDGMSGRSAAAAENHGP